MDPGLIFILAIVGFRILRAVQSQNKKRDGSSGMGDMTAKPARTPAPKPAGNPAAQRAPMDVRDRLMKQRKPAKHKRDRDDPFDGMHGDVLKSQLTIDDIVT